MADTPGVPTAFADALASLRQVRPRPEISLDEIPAPQRLAPHSYALSAHVLRGQDEMATGRFIVLHDPAGQTAWEGATRIVTYATAELDPEMVNDPMFASVGWAWLVDALAGHGAEHHAAGGTVTQICSTRFGEVAGPEQSADMELRASWTPTGNDLDKHLLAWCALLASTAGLPPPGIRPLPRLALS